MAIIDKVEIGGTVYDLADNRGVYVSVPYDDVANVPVASVPDGADDLPVKDLVVGISPVQDGSGDPSPSNVRPITGWTGANVVRTGKNLCDWKVNTTASALSISLRPGTYVISAKETLSTGNWYIRATDPSGEYSYSQSDLGLTGWTKTSSGWCYGGQNEQSQPFTVPNGCKLIEIGKLNADGTIPAQLEIGSVASEFEEYKGNTYPISWQTEAGTVYGGSLDVTTGVLTVDRKQVDMGSVDWSYTTYGFMQMTSVLSDIYHPATNTEATSIICDMLKSSTSGAVYSLGTGLGIHTNGNIRVYYPSMSTNPATFKSDVTGHKIVYPLATPVTYQLTPTEVRTLLGVNNIWSDTGNVISLEYPADTKLYIDKRISELVTQIVNA